MKFEQLIELVNPDAYNVAMNRMNILPSKIIGICLYRHKHGYSTDDDINRKHNPFGTINPRDGSTLSFETIYDGILNGLDDNFVMNNIDSDEVDRLIKIWYIKTYDTAFIKTMDKTIIDLSDRSKLPFMDIYTVKKDNTILLDTMFINEAIELAERNEGAIVTNSRGKVIDLNIVTNFRDMKVNMSKQPSNVYGTLAPNTKIVCTNLNLYTTPTDKTPSRCINGTYYVYDDTEINDMIHICNKTVSNGSDLTIPIGYVKKSELTT